MSDTLKVTLPVYGMHCASCASNIERRIKKLKGVGACEVSLGTEKIKLEYDPQKTNVGEMNKVIEPIGYKIGEDQHHENHNQMEHDHLESNIPKDKKLKDLKSQRNKLFFILPVTFATFILMMWEILSSSTFPIPMQLYQSVMLIVATIFMFWIGSPFIKEVVTFVKYRVANMYTLVGIGTLTAYFFSAFVILFPQFREALSLPEMNYFDVTIIVIGFVTLGRYLETKSKMQTGEAVEELMGLQAKKAILLVQKLSKNRVRELESRGYHIHDELEVNIDDIQKGDILLVKPGGRIPIDGIILNGSTSIDESMITGEPIPMDKAKGDNVVGGTINLQGAIQIEVVKVGEGTLLSQIIKLVEDAQSSKAPIQKLADQISSIFVPLVLIIALITLVSWLTIGTYFLGFDQALSLGILCFVSVLVIACPCALGLATPTAIVTGTGLGAKNGILIKNAESLEKLYKVGAVILDKTGTITIGAPSLTDVIVINRNELKETKAIKILASLEHNSEHPIAKAIIEEAKERGIELVEVENFRAIEGKGVSAEIINKDGRSEKFYAGNVKLIQELGVNYSAEVVENLTKEGKTPIILSNNKEVLAVFAVADKVKENAEYAIASLHELGLKVVMLTGDDKKTADYIAKRVGIDEVIANVLPHEKAEKVKQVQSEMKDSSRNLVAMVGDGINDAPALAQSDVGIAMSTGTDIAIESAEVILLKGDVSKIYKSIRLSRLTIRIIKQNLFWAFFYNILGIPLAAGLLFPFFGIVLNPIFAGLAMALSSVSVVANSLRLRFIKL